MYLSSYKIPSLLHVVAAGRKEKEKEKCIMRDTGAKLPLGD